MDTSENPGNNDLTEDKAKQTEIKLPGYLKWNICSLLSGISNLRELPKLLVSPRNLPQSLFGLLRDRLRQFRESLRYPDVTQDVGGYWDRTNGQHVFALEQLIREMGLGEKVTYRTGQKVYNKGDNADSLLILPQEVYLRIIFPKVDDGREGDISSVLRFGWRAVGEACLWGGARTATVQAVTNFEALKVHGKYLRSLMRNSPIRQKLQEGDLETNEANLLDKLLKYLAFECCFFVRNIINPNSIPDSSVEVPYVLKRNNPLSEYILEEDTLCKVIEQLKDERIGVKPMIEMKEVRDGKLVLWEDEDDTGGKFYIVMQGSVDSKGILPGNQRVTLARGTVFGEDPFIRVDKRTGSASVVGRGDMVAEVDTEAFLKFVNSGKRISLGSEEDLPAIALLYHIAAVNLGRIIERAPTA